MSTIAALPSTLRDKMVSLARRIRFLRAVRGTSLLLLVLVFLGGSALLADYAFQFPPLVLRIILASLLGVGGLVTLLGLVVPLCRRLDPEALAAVVETRYPELGERLTTTVELADELDTFHGSRQLIALVMKETETQTSALDFTRAFPSRTTSQLAAAALTALALAFVPALIWPQQYAELTRRLFTAFAPASGDGPAVLPGSAVAETFSLQVEPGDRFEMKGRPFTVQVHFKADSKKVALPPTCELVCTDAQEIATRYPMSAKGKDTFFFKLDRVAGDFRYHVEAGDKRSDTYRVSAVDSTITVEPPSYVNEKSLPKQTFYGLTDVSVLQFSKTTYAFNFSRPARKASFQLTAANGKAFRPLPVSLRGKQRQALIHLPALDAGTYQCGVVLEDETSRLSVLQLQPLTVWTDQPPLFGEVSWKDDPRVNTFAETDAKGNVFHLAAPSSADPIRYVPEGQRLPLELVVRDKVGLKDAGIEYRYLANPQVHVEEVLQAGGLQEAKAKHVFSLEGKLSPGGTILYRLRVRDNRKVLKGTFRSADNQAVPARTLHEQVAYIPKPVKGRDRWFTLTINPNAKRLRQQEMAQARRLRQLEIENDAREFDNQLQKIQQKLLEERRELNALRAQTRHQENLTPEQAKDLAQVQKKNESAKTDLHELADKAEEKADLLPLSKLARSIADQEMQKSQEALEQASRPKASDRAQEMHKADQQLAQALKKLNALRRQNQQEAQKKLDQLKLETVAEQQSELAKRATELAAKDPIKDRKAQGDLQQLQREQNELANKLDRLTQESKSLKDALNQARADEIRDLARRAHNLAKAQRDNDPLKNDKALAELARQQQQLAREAAKLAKETRQPAEAANTQPLKPEETAKAADALKKGNPTEALWRQEEAARELDRVSNDLKKAIELAKDPREAAQQLARLQQGLQKRLAEAMRKRNLKAIQGELQREQHAIQKAAENLRIPENNKAAQADQKQAAQGAARAAEALKRKAPAQANAQMAQAKNALERLAWKLPTLDQRRQRALQEVAQLKQQQDEIARKTDEAIKQAKQDPKAREALPQRLAEAAKRQAELAERLSKTDVPQHEARQQRTEKALNEALGDLVDGKKHDVPASQNKAQRELERLQQALAGQKPVDQKARELARQQKALAREARQLAANARATPQQKQDLQHRQQELAQQTKALPQTEAPQRQSEAAKATQKAAEAANNKPADKETQRQMDKAARALDRLAKQLRGQESPAAQAERLAKRQAQAAAEAERVAKKQKPQVEPAEAQRQQEQIAAEAKQVRSEDARAEKQRAIDALAKAQAAQPQEKAKAQRQAADALRDLADRLAGRKDAAAKAADIARRQRAMAKEAAQSDPKKGENQAKAQEAADRQADLARQLSRINPKGAEEAAKQAAEQMAAAKRALEKAKDPSEAKESLAKAAEAADKVAQQIAKAQPVAKPSKEPTETTSAKPADQSPRRQAQELARQQQQLARATQQAQQQARRQPTPQAKQQALEKALQRIAQQQQQLNKQASQLPVRQAEKALEQARQAMNQARQALAKNNPNQAQQQQQEAARALAKLARQVPDQKPKATAKTGRAPKDSQATPKGLPNKGQADKAQQLAKAQRDLRDEVQRLFKQRALASNQPNTRAELAKEQQAIARQAEQLAKNVAGQRGEKAKPSQQAQKAAKSAQQAAKELEAGSAKGAKQLGQKTAQQLRNLAQTLAKATKQGTPKEGDPKSGEPKSGEPKTGEPKSGEPKSGDPKSGEPKSGEPKSGDPKSGDPKSGSSKGGTPKSGKPKEGDAAAQSQEARQLAKKQDELTQRLQQTQQQELEEQAEKLGKDLDRLAQQSAKSLPVQQKLGEAARSAQQGQAAMQQAQNQSRQNNPPQAQQFSKEAANQLDQAAKQAEQAAQQLAKAGSQPKGGTPRDSEGTKTAKNVQDAQGQISQAQNKLGQGKTQSAKASMKSAADSLKAAAQQLAKSSQKSGKKAGKPTQPNTPGKKGAAEGDKPDPRLFGKDMKKYAGKTWGELPGELRTKIIQDMKAKYGDDYARIIKLYFEQIADARDRKKK